jgi:ribonuclease E
MNEETVAPERTTTEASGSAAGAAEPREGLAGAPSPEGGGSAAPRPRRRRRGGSGRSGQRPKASNGGQTQAVADDAAGPGTGDIEAVAGSSESSADAGGEGSPSTSTRPRRRRGRRGGRGRNRKPSQAATDESSGDAVETSAGDSGTSTRSAKAGAKPSGSAGDQERESEDAGGEESATTSGAKRRRRRRSGSGGASKQSQPAARAEPAKKSPPAKRSTVKPAKQAAAAEKETAGPTRTRRIRTPGQRRRRELVPIPKRSRDKIMLITEHGERDQIAVLEGSTLIEHYITRVGAHSMVGNIYQGRVQNVLPGMEAAFIDVGRGRNAVLYAGEVNWDEDVEGARRIEQALKPGQSVLVQVTKDPLGGKGARLTGEVSIPGRFLVMVPNSQVFGISRRLPDNERRRLRALARKLKPEGHGLIVRTAADGATEDDFAHDIERLVKTWEEIEKKAKKAKPPKVLYEEPELTVRVVRDLFNDEEFTEIVTDSVPVYDSVRTYLQDVAPDLVGLVHLHDGKLPLFEEYHLVEQIHKALERKVWLPSGGYIVIDRTEAMTVIDVNTGRHVGKTNLEETVAKTNVEAAEEVARQLRLRDIGGMIIIDFIDMIFEQNKQKVINTLKEALAKDKTRSQVFDISPLGLLEVTRKRVSAGLLESFSETCPTCEGRGILITHDIH